MKNIGRLFLVLAGFLFLAGTLSGAVIDVYPTNTSADVTNVQAAVDSSSAGDTIFLHVKNLSGTYLNYDFTSIPDGGIQVSTANLIIKGEFSTLGSLIVPTTINGPGSYDAVASKGAFQANGGADGLQIEHILFRQLEYVLLMDQGVDNCGISFCYTRNTSYGVFGVGDNDGLTVVLCNMIIVSNPEGGNACVTVLNGSDDLLVAKNILQGPGTETSPLAVNGVVDFNTTAAAYRSTIFSNKVLDCDFGVFLSSENSRLYNNSLTTCIDGAQIVSEVAGAVQGTFIVSRCTMIQNLTNNNTDDGIELFGVADSQFIANTQAGIGDWGIEQSQSSLGTSCSGNTFISNNGTVSPVAISASGPPSSSPTIEPIISPVIP